MAKCDPIFAIHVCFRTNYIVNLKKIVKYCYINNYQALSNKELITNTNAVLHDKTFD